MKLRRYGDRAVLIETDRPVAVRAGLLAQGLSGLAAVVPAARSVLVEFTGPVPELSVILDGLERSGPAPIERPPLELPVRYDGPDLATVAGEAGLSVAEVIAAHSEAEYTVLFCGFSPGFGYLTGLDERLHRPRLSTPRTMVPAGSVAIADEFTGVYPRASPGGWRLLGHTEATLFDLDQDPPAQFSPGRRVRFEAVPARPRSSSGRPR